MKQKLLNSIRLRVCMLVAILCTTFAGQAWADTTYKLTKVTSVSAGNKYVFEQNSHVLNNTVSSNALQTTGTYSTTGLTGTESYIWELETATGGFYLKNVSLKSNQYLNNTSSTNVSFGSKSSIWTIAFTDGIALISNKSNSNRFLGDTKAKSGWANAYKAYATGNLASYYHDFTVYLVEEEATPVTGVSLNKTVTTLEVGDQETLTATVAPDGATNKNVSWSSDDEDVATVDSNGKITAVAEGSATITVTTEDGSHTATCDVTVNAASKTAVNMTSFSADPTSIVVGNTTSTTVTNDQVGWSAAYSYVSSNTDVATVDESGVITAVAKGTATITASLNVSPSDAKYKAGTTTSMTVDITVTNPFHNVTFSSNGETYSGPTAVEEGEAISLPAVNPVDVNGYSFVGWMAGTIDGTTDDEPEFVTSPVMGVADVTYYAVFARVEESYSESEIEKTQTLQYDTWTYGGSTTNKTGYRLFHNGGYIESVAFDLSLLKKVIVYGGTFGGDGNNSFTIGDGTNTWKSATVSGNKETGTNEVTGGTSLTGTKKLYITSTCGSSSGSGSGIRISKVDIYTKKHITTCSNYCTTVTSLPLPVITMDDVEMTWDDDDKYVAPIATINEEAYEGSFTYTVDKVGLTVAADGKLTSSTPGTYVVTASIAATAEHQDASTTCTVTVGKQDVTLSFANGTVRKKTSDETYTQAATPTPAAYDGTITYSKENTSTSAGATVNSSTGAVAFSATGSVIVKATAPATDLYNSAEATYTILVQTTPTISVSNQTMAYGQTYTLDTSSFFSGDVTLSSSNAVATIDGLVITAAAEGTATITVTTAETDTYVEGEETFTFTVTAPEGLDEVPDPTPITVFYESFDECNQTGGNDGTWSGITGTAYDPTTDNDGWTWNKSAAASECARFGTGSALGYATTPALALEDGITYTLTFKAGAWNGGSESTTLKLSATNATIDKSSVTMSKGAWTTYTVTITDASSTAKITFTGNAASDSRFFLDEVLITKAGDPIVSDDVAINKYGYATYCSIYPMDFSDPEGYTAWRISSIDMDGTTGTVTCNKITGTIKGGQGVLLYNKDADGVNKTDVTVTFADGTTEFTPSENLLIGTTAPLYVASDEYFGLSGSNFVPVNPGVVPAGKALLDADDIPDFGSVKSFIFVFNDDATGITETRTATREEVEAIFNLGGQRMSKMQRGVNIVNGKKVLVK